MTKKWSNVKKFKHGRPRNYNSGTCRCEICTEAWRKYTAPYRKSYLERLKALGVKRMKDLT